MQNTEVNKLILEERKRLSMTGVDSVDGFSEQYVKITVSGAKVLISGEKLKITAYNKGNGNMMVEGGINEIKYNHSKQPLLKRIFK